MALAKREIGQRVNLLFDMLAASHGLDHWVYNAQGECLRTSSKSMVLDTILAHGGGKRELLEMGQAGNTPILLTLPLGLVWIVAFERQEDRLERAYVLGPAFHTEISIRGIVGALERYKIPQGWKLGFMDMMKKLPVLSISSLRRAAVMLHLAVNDEAISILDVIFRETEPASDGTDQIERKDRHRTYMAEQNLLNNVRKGNLDYQSALVEAGAISYGVQTKTSTSVDHVRISEIVFISLCVRAAIEGGLTPEIAYSTGDAYIQQINDTEDITRMGNIGHSMYQTFIQMVHNHKQKVVLSKPVQTCCDYINLHLEDELTMEMVSQRVGYTANYLAKRFTKEVGISPTQYIQRARIDRACQMLVTTPYSIPEISQRLHFCNRGYFSRVFKEQMGVTPVEYRNKNQIV